VIRVDPATGAQTTVSSGGSFDAPSGIALEADGDILVADVQAFADFLGGVIRVDPATGAQTTVSSGGSFLNPFGVAVVPTPTDTTPPETQIDSGPQGLTNQTSPSFEFSADEPATFECRIDAGSFAPCESGDSFGPLSDGPHTFFVRAIDLAGNVDETPAERSLEVRACTISGNNNANTLHGTRGDDVLCGFGGNDTINPSLGNDIVFGGTGNDYISPGFGDDRLLGQDGNDSVNGGPGNDELDGGAGTDTCTGGLGFDTAVGCEGVIGVP
jgi:hypothetical protein